MCSCILTATYHMKSGAKFSTFGVISVLERFRIFETLQIWHFRIGVINLYNMKGKWRIRRNCCTAQVQDNTVSSSISQVYVVSFLLTSASWSLCIFCFSSSRRRPNSTSCCLRNWLAWTSSSRSSLTSRSQSFDDCK